MKRPKKRAKKRKTKRQTLPAVRSPVEYVTREMLTRLRDEIENLLDGNTAALDRAERELRHRDGSLRRAEERVEEIGRTVHDIRGLLGLEHIPRHRSALHEPVTWSYFHVWIARISDRLEKLEKTMQ
jgi:hypothetical protein